MSVRSTSRPRGYVSSGRVVYRSFLIADHAMLSPPSPTGPRPTCPMVLLVALHTSKRCLNGVQFFSQALNRASGRSIVSTMSGSNIPEYVTEPSFARVLTKMDVSMGFSASQYVTKKTAFSTQRMSSTAKTIVMSARLTSHYWNVAHL